MKNKKQINEERKEYNLIQMKAREIADKNINRNDKCEICGSTDRLILHHWRYDKPLLVNTLCSECHNIQHVKKFDRWHTAKVMSEQLLEVAS